MVAIINVNWFFYTLLVNKNLTVLNLPQSILNSRPIVRKKKKTWLHQWCCRAQNNHVPPRCSYVGLMPFFHTTHTLMNIFTHVQAHTHTHMSSKCPVCYLLLSFECGSYGAVKQHICDKPLLSGAFLQNQLVAKLVVAARHQLQAPLWFPVLNGSSLKR